MADTSIKISLELADKAAQQALGNLAGNSDKAERSFKKLRDSGQSTFSEISVGIGKSIGVYDIFVGNLAANVALEAFGALKDAASALFNTFIVDGVKAAQVQEEAVNSLSVAMATAGEFSQEALEDFKSFASGIQAVTTVGDEAVLSQLSLAKAYGASNEQAKEIVRAAVELSAAMGINLDAATQRVSKTLGGLAGELGEVNPAIKALTKEQLKAGEAAKILIDQYSGSGEGKVRTFSGAVAQAGNAFGDLQESIGSIITQNPVVIAAINQVSTILQSATSAISGSEDGLKNLVARGFIALVDGSKYVIDAFNALYKVGGFVFNGLQSVIYGAAAAYFNFVGLIDKESEAIGEEFTTVYDEIAGKLNKAFDANAVDDFSLALSNISMKSKEAFEQMKVGADSATPALQNTKRVVSELTAEQQRQIEANTKFTEDLAKKADDEQLSYQTRLDNLKTFYELQGLAESEADITSFEAKLIREQEYFEARQSILDEQEAEELARVERSKASEQDKANARVAIQRKYNAESEKLTNELVLKEQRIAVEKKKREEIEDKAKLQATASLFGSLGSLAETFGREGFEAAKALNSAQAFISGILAVQNTLASVPYPANIVAAAAVGIQTAANLARIQNAKAPAFADGGIVPGSSFSGDRVTARLNSGEMVLNRSQQAELFNVANGSGAGGDVASEIRALAAAIRSQPVQVSIDGSAVFSAVRTEIDRGRTL